MLFLRSYSAFFVAILLQSASTRTISIHPEAGGITQIGSGSFQPGISPTIITSQHVSSNSTANATDIRTDEWPIEGTKFLLRLDYDRSKGIPEEDLEDILKDATTKIDIDMDPDEKISTKWDYTQEGYNALFEIEPTIADLLTWRDVTTCIEGLRQYYHTVRNFIELRYTLIEKRPTEKASLATGGLLRKAPTPPPPTK